MRARHGAPLCVLALLCLASGRHDAPIDVHPFPICCFVERAPDPTYPKQMRQFDEMNRSFELQYIALLYKILEEAPRQKRRWRVYTRGAVTVLRRPSGREPQRTLTSLTIVKYDNWTDLTWMGRRYRWNATTFETDERMCGCNEAGEIFFERRGMGDMRCWDSAGKTVSCDGVSIPERDTEWPLEMMLR